MTKSPNILFLDTLYRHVPACDGQVRTVLAPGAQPCVLLCVLPDSRPSYRWYSVSVVCSAGTLTQTNKPLATCIQGNLHAEVKKILQTSHAASMCIWYSSGNPLQYKDEICKIWTELLLLNIKSVSHWIRQQAVTGVATAGDP